MLWIPLVAVALFYLVYEFTALVFGFEPLTPKVRRAFYAYPPLGFLVGLGAGLLLAHLFWSGCIEELRVRSLSPSDLTYPQAVDLFKWGLLGPLTAPWRAR